MGQAFRKGQVPHGRALVGNIERFQADIRNRWEDGSVRFAVLSGVATPGYLIVSKGAPAPVGATVPEPNVAVVARFSAVVDAAGAAVAGGSFEADIAAARSSGVAWSRTQAALVRSILGPVMSEFHYFVPTPDPHTHVWFYVRAYVTGQIEVETVVENGWLRVSAPGSRTYNFQLLVGGSPRVEHSALRHRHHTRFSRVDWVGADPQFIPRHQVEYLQATSLVPTLAVNALSSRAYSTTPDAGTKYSAWTLTAAQQGQPFGLANIDPALGSGGHSDNVGLLPAWDMAYLVEGHEGAYLAVQANYRAGGRFSVHYRDEATGRPARGSQHPTLGLHDTNVGIADNAGNSPLLTPAPAGGVNNVAWGYSHGPSLGYLAYLTSGRWSAWEELQFISSTADFFQSGNLFGGFRIGPWYTQLRVHAWIYRTRAQAALVAPEFLNDAPLTDGLDRDQRTEAMGRLDADIDYYHGVYVSGSVTSTPSAARNNVFGLFYMNQDYDEANDNEHSYGGMMLGYNALAVMWSCVADATTNPRLLELATFVARFPVGMLGAAPDSSQWDWRLFAFYQASFGNGGWNGSSLVPTRFRSSWDDQWRFISTPSFWPSGGPAALPTDNRMRSFFPGAGTGQYVLSGPLGTFGTSSHVVAMVACVAFAHELAAKTSVPGAENMAARFYGSDTWRDSVATAFRDYPGWAIRSRRI